MKVQFGLGALLACCVVLLGACGSDSGGGGSSGGGEKKISGAKVIDVKSMESPPKGTVKFCQGKDTTGIGKRWSQTSARSTRGGLQGDADRVPGVGGPAARPVHPAPAGEVR